MISRIFTLCIPFVGSLAVYWKPLPLVVLGTPTVLSGCLALLLPETSGKDLPQTIYEADQVIANIQGVSWILLYQVGGVGVWRKILASNHLRGWSGDQGFPAWGIWEVLGGRVGGEGAIEFRGFSVGEGENTCLKKFAKLTWKSLICWNSTNNKLINWMKTLPVSAWSVLNCQ